ncbi:hypothetical protein Adu01nite_73880 [Paractinoplanes durhamensis]|uniref:Uncharacterized protein n=2 Tax=Paractinoplanes durhamensis TaxID=113563 RepID=A0ABQ3Z894_9ACTN|nr:hypothetical protein [Actinoplanes durhamensis]GIE06038.1 hypothetical protein Adu01nite_73880 [Actinoplanes durhamensis]
MADQQRDDNDPAAELPEATRIDGGEDPSTVDAPARWSGSAVVPPPAPKKSRWTRRRPEPDDERAAIPAVDPWAGQDTPWDGFPVVPQIAETDPTKLDQPVEMPPTRIESPAPAAPPPAAPQPKAPAPPKPPKLSRHERKAREKAAAAHAAAQIAAQNAAARAAQARPPANRLPVQTRPGAPGRLPPPPPWAAPRPQRPMPPPRRKRRWGRRLALLTVLGVLCCCGGPFAYFQFPAARQYPVSADLPASFSDLQLRDDNASKRAADRLADQLRSAKAADGTPFAGVYGDSRGKRVTVFGVTGWRFTPKSDVQAQLDNLADQLNLKQVQQFDLGETGAHESCGIGRVDGSSVVVCAWADHGSLATVLLTRRSIKDSAALVSSLRSEVLTPAAG